MEIYLSLATAVWLTGLQAFVLLWDITRYRIPNRLSLLLAGSFVPFALLSPVTGWYWHVVIGAGVLAIGYSLFCLKVIGGGDAKWLAACCLWTGPAATLPFLMVTAVIGGVFTLLLLLVRGIARGMVGKRSDLPKLLQPFGPVPYGVAIALAFIWLLMEGEMPRLSLGIR